jgi:AraC-like DNA-binding protein
MQLLHFAPNEKLAPFVRTISVLEVTEETTRTLVPDVGLVLGFRYSGSACDLSVNDAPLPDAVLTGVRRTARRMRTSAGGGIVLVSFHEGGAAPFFPAALHSLFGQCVDLRAILPAASIESLQRKLALGGDGVERVALVSAFLESLQCTADLDPIVLEALRSLDAEHGTLRIEDLAARFSLSWDRFEKRFRRAVGATPKQHASLLRLRRAIALHRTGAPLAQVSLEAGYCDQAHFSREFRSFTGHAPRQFFRNVSHC